MGKASTRMQYAASFSVSVAYMASNMIGGWLAPMMPRLQAEDSPIPLTNAQVGWITSISSLTTILPIIFVPFTVDVIGRKKLLVYVAIPFLAHWFLIGFADSYGVLLSARIVESLGSGVLTTVGPMYLSEIADSRIRGAVGTLHNVMANLGTVIVYSIAPYTSIQLSSLLLGSFVVLYGVSFLLMPDSPFFFMLRGRENDAVKSLLWLRRSNDRAEVEEELTMMKKAVEQNMQTKGQFKDLFQQRVHRRTFFILIGLDIIQMMCGSGTIMTYSTAIFESSGSGFDSNVSSIIVAVVRLFMTAACVVLVDRVGRRPLMIGTAIVCGVAITVLGTYFYFAEVHGGVPAAFDWVPLTSFILFEMSYWCGIGPTLTTVTGEMFHMSVKGLATSIKNIINGFVGFALKELFVIVTDTVGTYCMFWGFAFFCFLNALYTYILLPETKGKTFVQINEEMDARTERRKRNMSPATDKEKTFK